MTRNQLSFSSIVLPLLLTGAVTACGAPEDNSPGDGTAGVSSTNGSAGGTSTGPGGTTTGTSGPGTSTSGTASGGDTGGTNTGGTGTGVSTSPSGTTTGDATGGTMAGGTMAGGTMAGGDMAGGDMGGGTMAGGTMAGGDMGGGDMAGGDMAGGTMAGGDMGGGDMAGGDMGGGTMAGGTMAGGTMAGGDMGGGDMGGAGGSCSFTIIEDGVSTAIGSVGIVKWSASEAVNDAVIEFDLADGSGVTLTAPVDLEEPDYRTLLLGMKAGREYVYRIKINSGACVSDDYPIETDPAPNSVPIVNATNGDAGEFGFIVTSAGLGNAGGGFGGGFAGGGGGGSSSVYIFDTDGDIVWWTDAPGSCSRARMDYEGKNLWMTALNYPSNGTGTGEMRYVSMDGLEGENNVQGLADNHHDFTVAPGGIVTAILWSGGNSDNSIVERSPDGSINTIVESVGSTLYQCVQECHGNSITYHPDSDTYVLSDRNPNLYVNFDRSGTLLWQAGGNNPRGTHYAGSWSVNHGHQLLDNGNLLIFNNGQGQSSPVIELALSGSSATEVWSYATDGSTVLGDVQRLENGNTVITYSNRGRIVEVANDSVVREYSTDSLGYSMFRSTLYGPPPK